jgi:hypothetical protein
MHFRACGTEEARSFLAPLGAEPAWRVLADDSDTWGHGRHRYDAVVGAFALTACGVMRGPVSDKLVQKWAYGSSKLDVVYTRYAQLPGIHADVAVLWNEPRSILKLELDAAGVGGPALTMQCAGGTVSRAADGSELPLHHWVWLPGETAGLSVVQYGAYACDSTAGRLRLTLLRSSLYGFEDRREVFDIDPQHDTDLGPRRFRVQFLPGIPCDAARLDQAAAILNEPLTVIRES